MKKFTNSASRRPSENRMAGLAAASEPDLKMEVLDPTSGADATGWDRDVRRNSAGSIFHSSAWARVLSKTYGHTPLYLRFHRGLEMVGLIPIHEVSSPVTGRRGVCVPFSDHCRPLLLDAGIRGAVIDRLASFASERGWRSLELRGGGGLNFPGSYAPPTFVGHQLNLCPGEGELFRGCASSTRRAIRKAERSGIEIRIERGESAIRDYFRLHLQTRRRHGVPPQPKAFFESIYREILACGKSGFVAFAESGGQSVAGAVFLRFGNSAIYKFGASDARSWNLRPNHLLMWKSICELASTGVETFSFGRTDIGQQGLRRFKASWGATEQDICYLRYDVRDQKWENVTKADPGIVSHLGHGLIRHLPTSFNRLAGRLVYPHLD